MHGYCALSGSEEGAGGIWTPEHTVWIERSCMKRWLPSSCHPPSPSPRLCSLFKERPSQLNRQKMSQTRAGTWFCCCWHLPVLLPGVQLPRVGLPELGGQHPDDVEEEEEVHLPTDTRCGFVARSDPSLPKKPPRMRTGRSG